MINAMHCFAIIAMILSFFQFSSAQPLQIDSVKVDSVWNSDSSWYDANGIQKNRQSRDCKLSFFPSGAGTVQTFVSLSTDSGKTWIPQTDGYNHLFPCGVKSSLTLRILGGDRPNAAFQITGRQYRPIITGKSKIIYFPATSVDPLPGSSAEVPLIVQHEKDVSKGYAPITRTYWDVMGDGSWDDSTTSLNWIWNTTIPFGESGQQRSLIAKAHDANGLWSFPETLTVQFGGFKKFILREGFENDLSQWERDYMVGIMDFYPRMRITSNAAHSGTHAVTTDSNRTALYHRIEPRLDSGICGVEFYIMAKSKGQIKFEVKLGQNAGSSGGLSKSFGIGFDVLDSISTSFFDSNFGWDDKAVSALVPDHWYKCNVEINFTTRSVQYFIDNTQIVQKKLPVAEMYGIDRLLIYRGLYGGTSDNPIECSEGAKQYFVDDIVIYTK